MHSLRARFLRKLHLGYNYLIIGSSITKLTNERSIIWGAGAIDDEEPLRIKPKKVLAVRGPKTREYLLKNGVECPAVYGDPAMLIKYFYYPKIQKNYKLGPAIRNICDDLINQLNFAVTNMANSKLEKGDKIREFKGFEKDWQIWLGLDSFNCGRNFVIDFNICVLIF